MVLARSSNHHGLADETAEKRHCGNGKRANHVKAKRYRHGLVKPAHLAQFSQTGRLQDGACSHEEERFIKDVCEGVAVAPFAASALPIPTPQTMYPTWLTMW